MKKYERVITNIFWIAIALGIFICILGFIPV
jgi:hypothetical protein